VDVIVLILLIAALVALLVAAVLAHRARDVATTFLAVGLSLWLVTVLLGGILA
jgi:hypothetical protein